MLKKLQITGIILFFSFLFSFGLLTFILPKDEFSDIENRSLEKFPSFSFAEITNRDFITGFESYFSDHFAMRSKWISIKTDTELVLGKTLVNDVYFADNMLIPHVDEPDLSLADKNAEAVNKFAEKHDIPVYMMIAPTSSGIYYDTLPKNAPQYNQKSYIEYFYNRLSDSVSKLDVYSSLYSIRDEYIYYRNDHHWTTSGAYGAYSASVGRMGLTPVSYSGYDIEHASSDFYGALYSRVLSKKYSADSIDIFHRNNGNSVLSVAINDGSSEEIYDNMYFREYLSAKDKYSTYLGENVPLIKINTDIQGGKKLLVIKDSYANCFIPFLTQHYSEIAVVDMRKLDALSFVLENYIEFDSYSQVLILYNADTLSEDDDLKKITR